MLIMFCHRRQSPFTYLQIRVSTEISNAPIILNVDCDMYSSDPDAIKDALCFFLDEKHGSQTSYVQHPQRYNNVIKNDVYANINSAVNQVCLSIPFLLISIF